MRVKNYQGPDSDQFKFKVITPEQVNLAAIHTIAVVAPNEAENHDTTNRSNTFKDFSQGLATSQHASHARICRFSFDFSGLLSGAASVRDLSTALRKSLAHALGQAGSSHRIVFVTHSIGSWVVRDLLSSPEPTALKISMRTRGAIFLDTPMNAQEHTLADIKHYLDALQSLWYGQARHMRFTENLAKEFGTIGVHFKSILDSPSAWKAKYPAHEWPNITTRYLSVSPTDSMGLDTLMFPKNASWQREVTLNKSLKGPKSEPNSAGQDFDTHNDPMELDATLRSFLETSSEQSQSPIDIRTQSSSHKDTQEALQSIPHLPDDTHMVPQSEGSLAIKIILSDSGGTSPPASLTEPSSPKSLEHWTTTKPQPNTTPKPSQMSISLRHEIDHDLNMGEYHCRIAEYVEARVLLLNAKNLLIDCRGPDAHRLRIATYEQLGVVSLYLGRQSEALAEFERLLEEAHKLEHAQPSIKMALVMSLERWRAVVWLHQGHYRKAADEFERLLKQSRAPWVDNAESWKIFRIDIQRDRSLAVAHLGPFSKVREQIESAKDEVSSPIGPQVSKKKDDDNFTQQIAFEDDRLCLTEAAIYSLWGFGKEALTMSSKARKRFCGWFGNHHIITLQCASLNALVLAKDSQFNQAFRYGSRAVVTMERITDIQELEPCNPFVLEVKARLVRILNLQYLYPAAAMEEAVGLVASAEQTFGQKHPQTLEFRLLLSETQLVQGDYLKAVASLRDLSRTSKSIYGDENLTTLVHCSTYARALLMSGYFEEAGGIAFWTLQKQRGGLSLCGSTDAPLRSDTSTLIDETLDTVFNDGDSQNGASSRVHPSLLFNLETLALVKARSIEAGIIKPNWHFVNKILSCCWRRKHTDLGRFHNCALSAEFELAGSIQMDTDEWEQCAEKQLHLRNIYLGRMIKLGENHAETLVAKRELIVLSRQLNMWRDLPDFADVETWEIRAPDEGFYTLKDASDAEGKPFDKEIEEFIMMELTDVYQMHQKQLGETHPETLKSLLWVFIMQAFHKDGFDDHDLHEGSYMCLLLSRLRQPIVVQQRLTESVRMRLEIVDRLLQCSFLLEALDILRKILHDTCQSAIFREAISNDEADQSPILRDAVFNDEIHHLWRVTLHTIETTSQRALSIHEPKLKRLRADFDEAKRCKDASGHEEACRHISEIIWLCETLYGPESVEALSAWKEQAVLAWSSEDESKMEDAVKTMEQSRDGFKKAGEDTQEKEAQRILDGWVAELKQYAQRPLSREQEH